MSDPTVGLNPLATWSLFDANKIESTLQWLHALCRMSNSLQHATGKVPLPTSTSRQAVTLHILQTQNKLV